MERDILIVIYRETKDRKENFFQNNKIVGAMTNLS